MFGPETFRLLNETHSLSEQGWDDPRLAKLWRYNLHYFDDLNARGNQHRRQWHKVLICRWIVENQPANGTGWEAYPTSLRIVNWIKWSLAGNDLPYAAFHSLSVQARWLSHRLEHHLLGNHLLANAKALIFAGVFFEGPEASTWRRTGLEILRAELKEQFLADGAHFELSPLYHALALEDLLDLFNLSRTFHDVPECAELSDSLTARIQPARRWLASMSHPDGELSFFNDAAIGIAPSPASLEAYSIRLQFGGSPPPHLGLMEPSGYVRLSSGDATLIFDAARVGPDHQPGHAHADTLSFELSLFGSRLLVNSGTSTYAPGAERQRQRETEAHNTVVIGNENSSEIWAAFRVARRAKPFSRTVSGNQIVCSHDGYKRLKGSPVHKRTLALSDDTLTVLDEVTGGTQDACDFFHFHPDWKPTISPCGREGRAFSTSGLSVGWTIERGNGVLASSSYHPEFGKTVEACCLIIKLVSGKAATSFHWQAKSSLRATRCTFCF